MKVVGVGAVLSSRMQRPFLLPPEGFSAGQARLGWNWNRRQGSDLRSWGCNPVPCRSATSTRWTPQEESNLRHAGSKPAALFAELWSVENASGRTSHQGQRPLYPVIAGRLVLILHLSKMVARQGNDP
jgi:hypothetical protein